jgi:hypothetical protein
VSVFSKQAQVEDCRGQSDERPTITLATAEQKLPARFPFQPTSGSLSDTRSWPFTYVIRELKAPITRNLQQSLVSRTLTANLPAKKDRQFLVGSVSLEV